MVGEKTKEFADENFWYLMKLYVGLMIYDVLAK